MEYMIPLNTSTVKGESNDALLLMVIDKSLSPSITVYAGFSNPTMMAVDGKDHRQITDPASITAVDNILGIASSKCKYIHSTVV